MKAFAVAVVLALVGVVLVLILLNWFQPGQAELRDENARIALDHTRKIEPLRYAVQQVLEIAKGLGGLALGLIAFAAGLVALAFGLGAVGNVKNLWRWGWLRSWLVKPGSNTALYPALAEPDGQGHVRLLAPVNEPGAQKVAALTAPLKPDVRLMGSAARAALRNDPNETIMPDTEPAAPPLPARMLIYSAPLADTLHLPIGHDGYGPVQLPLRDLGSGIVGGLPKMGKSECVASMMAGLLRQDATGTHIQLAVSDLKGGVDFGRMPDSLAGLAWPVAKTPEEAVGLINNVWAEVERRQGLLERAGAARVEVYNERPGVARLPYLFLVIDELAMITMAAEERGIDKATRQKSAEFNGRAIRIVSVGRALGISLIGATQRPSGTVIPTQLRDLCGFRIAFRCMTADASKAVLGVPGAEELPEERGLALFLGDQAQPRRIRTYLAVIDGGKFDGFVKRLPRRERLLLPADAAADGTGADDLPDSPGVVTVNAGTTVGLPVVGEEAERPTFGRSRAYSSSTVAAASASAQLPLSERVKRVPKDHVPHREVDQETIFELWEALERNSAATQREIYEYDGGKANYWVAFAINRALARRGQAPMYKEQAK